MNRSAGFQHGTIPIHRRAVLEAGAPQHADAHKKEGLQTKPVSLVWQRLNGARA